MPATFYIVADRLIEVAASPVDPSTIALVENLTKLSATALAFLLLWLLVTNKMVVTKVRFDEQAEHFRERLADKDRELTALAEDRDWWKDATVTALQIGEVVAGRAVEPPKAR